MWPQAAVQASPKSKHVWSAGLRVMLPSLRWRCRRYQSLFAWHRHTSEHDLLVKVVLMPDGDPDSHSRKLGPQGFQDYLADEAVDFIHFKTRMLFDSAKDDPVLRWSHTRHCWKPFTYKRPILRSTYSTSTTNLLIDKQTLLTEINKQRLQRLKGKALTIKRQLKLYGQKCKRMGSKKSMLKTTCHKKPTSFEFLQYGDKLLDSQSCTVTSFICNQLDEIAWIRRIPADF